jgi:hypothetical protein
MTRQEYVVTVPSELSAGLRGFTDSVAIELEDFAFDRNDLLNDMVEHFRNSIAEWYDVATKCVSTKAEYDARIQQENAEMESDA